MSEIYMKTGASDLKAIDDLNAIVLNEEEMFKVLYDASRTYQRGMCSHLIGWLTAKKIYDEIPEKAKAILARLDALSVMVASNELDSWLPSDEIKVMPAIAHKALVTAAAVHPLSIINGDITFEKESFLRKILEIAESEGSHSN
jgi:hypothetical protein